MGFWQCLSVGQSNRNEIDPIISRAAVQFDWAAFAAKQEAGMRALLKPYLSVSTCPGCGADTTEGRQTTVEYSTSIKVRGAPGSYVSTLQYGDPAVPHLERRCRCGFAWLEETATDVTSDATC